MNFVDSLQSKIAAYHRKIMVKFLWKWSKKRLD